RRAGYGQRCRWRCFSFMQLARPQNYKFMLPAELGMALWLAGGFAGLWHFSEAATARSSQRQANLKLVSRATALMAAAWLISTLVTRLPALYSDPALQRANYRGIVQTITATLREGDAIILDAPNQAEVFNYYYHGEAPVYGLPVGLGGDDPQTRAAVEDIIASHSRAFVVFWGEAERDPQRTVETTLDSLAYSAGDQWFGDVRLSRYLMPQPFSIERESGAQFGENITLLNYALNSETLASGDALQVQLHWQTDRQLDTRYKVFVQLLDANGALQTQHDGEPGGGLQPTTIWQAGETIADNHALILPDTLPAGEYTVIVGLYQLDPPYTRLPVGDGDYVTLGTIRVR
ncbi:MAG: glycosyl transferase family protein, partial [Chloroflexi bacterium OLB15]